MASLLNCPNCGARNVYDFRFSGEVLTRPEPDADSDVLTEYFYFRENIDGEQREWWNHAMGCRKWFIATRNTRSNEVLSTQLPGEPADGAAQ